MPAAFHSKTSAMASFLYTFKIFGHILIMSESSTFDRNRRLRKPAISFATKFRKTLAIATGHNFGSMAIVLRLWRKEIWAASGGWVLTIDLQVVQEVPPAERRAKHVKM